jgi:hypothetical protein
MSYTSFVQGGSYHATNLFAAALGAVSQRIVYPTGCKTMADAVPGAMFADYSSTIGARRCIIHYKPVVGESQRCPRSTFSDFKMQRRQLYPF